MPNCLVIKCHLNTVSNSQGRNLGRSVISARTSVLSSFQDWFGREQVTKCNRVQPNSNNSRPLEKPKHFNTGHQNVKFSNASGIHMFGIRIPTVFRYPLYLISWLAKFLNRASPGFSSANFWDRWTNWLRMAMAKKMAGGASTWQSFSSEAKFDLKVK